MREHVAGERNCTIPECLPNRRAELDLTALRTSCLFLPQTTRKEAAMLAHRADVESDLCVNQAYALSSACVRSYFFFTLPTLRYKACRDDAATLFFFFNRFKFNSLTRTICVRVRTRLEKIFDLGKLQDSTNLLADLDLIALLLFISLEKDVSRNIQQTQKRKEIYKNTRKVNPLRSDRFVQNYILQPTVDG